MDIGQLENVYKVDCDKQQDTCSDSISEIGDYPDIKLGAHNNNINNNINNGQKDNATNTHKPSPTDKDAKDAKDAKDTKN